MKVCIHLEPSGGVSLGGADVLSANVAATLRSMHRVEIVHHRSTLSISELAAFAGVDLGGVSGRYTEPRVNYFWSNSSNPLQMYRQPRRWGRELAGDCDVLISVVHELPPFNPARKGIVLLLFPLHSVFETWPFASSDGGPTGLKTRLAHAFYRMQYRALWRGYGVRLAISEFTSRWAQRRWRIGCSVLYPVVDSTHVERAKENVIVTLGRFATAGVSKRQRELATAFGQATAFRDWRLTCLGAAKTADELRYVDDVKSQGNNVVACVNASRADVKEWLGRARIFWHAAGLFEDEDRSPELMEHFGMSTVEAMSSGCVPVVIGRGGQTEIVEDGKSGFLCQSVEEIVERSAALAADPALWHRMSKAATLRARDFAREAFEQHLRRLAPFLWDGSS